MLHRRQYTDRYGSCSCSCHFTKTPMQHVVACCAKTDGPLVPADILTPSEREAVGARAITEAMKLENLKRRN